MDDLKSRYWSSFFICSILCIFLQFLTKSKPSKGLTGSNPTFLSFQRTYLIVYLLAMFSDWLQGPYVYELYVSYGFSQEEIAQLFVCGFASSMFVGTFVGGLADTIGRKNMCIMYSICYIIACCTKLVPEFWTLMLGRFLSGISTSLLFSVFESWMVCEHFKQGFDSSSLGDTFAYATFGNGLVAVLAGLCANTVAESFGFVAPFVVAILPLTCVMVIIFQNWTENYGNQQTSLTSSLIKGFSVLKNDYRIIALALSQSCFEGAMYTFVFMWTPALKSEEEINSKDPNAETTSQYLGLIFAVYMICVMIGSSLFEYFSKNRDFIYKIPLFLHAFAFLSTFITTTYIQNKFVVYTMFLIFETCVGVFYPAYGVIKSEHIPEEVRSALMNIFRIPLNAFVVILLLKITSFTPSVVFLICSITHALAFVSYYVFFTFSKDFKGQKTEDKKQEAPFEV